MKFLIFIFVALPFFTQAQEFKVQCNSGNRSFTVYGDNVTKKMSIIDISNATKKKMKGKLDKFTTNYDIQTFKKEGDALELKGVLTHSTGKSYIYIQYRDLTGVTLQTAALSNNVLAHALMEFKRNCISIGIN